MATTWQPGMRITAARLNAMDDVPILNVKQAATGQTLTTGGWYPVLFSNNPASEVVDSAGGFTFSSNGRYTSQVAGWYWVSGGVVFDQSATGARGAHVYKNGAAVQDRGGFLPVSSGTIISGVPIAAGPVRLEVGDYVEMRAFQNSGGNLNTFVGADQASSLSLFWLTS